MTLRHDVAFLFDVALRATHTAVCFSHSTQLCVPAYPTVSAPFLRTTTVKLEHTQSVGGGGNIWPEGGDPPPFQEGLISACTAEQTRNETVWEAQPR